MVRGKQQKRNMYVLVCIIITTIIVILGIVILIKNNYTKNNLNTYNISLNYDDSKKTIEAEETIEYINETDADLDSIYFHMYPNAFKYKDKVPFKGMEFRTIYPEKYDSGYMEIKSVECGGKEMRWAVIGTDQTILKIELDKTLNPQEKTSIKIVFKDKVPLCYGRYGYGKNTVNICNWYPIVAVYDKKYGWKLNSYQKYGDPFYSDVANYNIQIKTNKNYIIAHTGDLKTCKESDNYKTWSIVGENVRDFSIILSKKFKIYQDTVQGVLVKSYAFDKDFGKKACEFARLSIEAFNNKFGQYPYKQYSVVQSDFNIGGMEYPNLSMIDNEEYNKKREKTLEYIIAHETAHQWWYGIVGNDEVSNAWMDESLTEYSTILYYESVYGRDVMEKVYKEYIVDSYKDAVPFIKDKNLRRDLNEFDNVEEYSGVIYNRGAIIFNNLRKRIGDKVFFDALKNYYSSYKYKNAYEDDLIGEFNKTSGNNYKGIFYDWLMGKESLSLEA